MPVRFILGRAGSGKTHHCLTAAAEALRAEGSDRLILLVPEQASFQVERALAQRAPGGAFSRAEVLSFTRLAKRVLGARGEALRWIGPESRALALRAAAQRHGPRFAALAESVRTAGFYPAMQQTIQELMRERVSPEALLAGAEQIADGAARARITEIARLYAAYQEFLRESNPRIHDEAERLELLRAGIAGCPWLRTARVWVDGFAGFTGQELAMLTALARNVAEIEITLLIDPADLADGPDRSDPLRLFRRTEQTLERLRKDFHAAGIDERAPLVLDAPAGARVRASRFEAIELRDLERELVATLQDRGAAVRPDGSHGGSHRGRAASLRIGAYRTHRDELCAAAREIRRKVAAREARYRDFAVIVRDLEPLADMVAEVFREYEIPCFLDRRRAIGGHPLSRLIEAAFAVVTDDLPPEAMTRLLETGLMPFDEIEAEQLARTISGSGVRGAAIWRQPHWIGAADDVLSFDTGEWTGDRPPGAPKHTALDRARMRLIDALDPLIHLAQGVAARPARGGQLNFDQAVRRPTGRSWAEAVHAFLTELRVDEPLRGWIRQAQSERNWEAAETHRLAWDALIELLDKVHVLLSETELSAAEMAGLLTASLAEMTVGLSPPTLDQVLVSAIERSRHPEIRHAWLIGLNEGIFPAAPAVPTLLSEDERLELARAGIELPGNRDDQAADERLLAYIALTRASQTLTVSHANFDDEGAPLAPSPLLGDICQAAPQITVETQSDDEPPVCAAELARRALLAYGREASGPGDLRCLRLLEELRGEPAQPAANSVLRLLRGRRYSNTLAAVGSGPGADGGFAWIGSASELNSWLHCPFQHFLRYRLHLRERPRESIQRVLGEATHEILRRTTELALAKLAEPPGPPGQSAQRRIQQLTQDDFAEALDCSVAEFRAGLPKSLSKRRPDVSYMLDSLIERLRDVVAAHADRWRLGALAPVFTEKPFHPLGGNDALAVLTISLSDGRRIGVSGRIDRVDMVQRESGADIIVYDYKARAGTPRRPFVLGEWLQLMIYMVAVKEALPGGVVAAGGLIAPYSPDCGLFARKNFQAASVEHRRMLLFRPGGIFDERLAEALDRRGEADSPAASMTRKKDGTHGRYSHAVSSEEMEQRMGVALQTIRLAAEGIVGGDIRIAPLVANRCLPCRHCEFQPVCRFDRRYNRVRTAERDLPNAADGDSETGEPQCN